jgi:O-antigen/teichoic acid export membrane protein
MQKNQEPESLARRVIKAGAWALGGNFSAQALRLLSNLILTRLLLPEAFGLMAVVLVFVIGLGMLSDAGTSQALVRSARGGEAVFRQTVWTVQVVRGGILAGVCLVSGATLYFLQLTGWVSSTSTYAHPMLPGLLAAYAFCPLVQGFVSTKLVMAQRALQTRITATNALLGQALSLPVTVGVAHATGSPWALVVGAWVAAVIQVLHSHFFIRGDRDAFRWDRASLTELATFGRWVMLASMVGFFASSGDRVMLSGLLSASEMGLYAIAFLIVNVFQTLFSMLLGNVIFPALSEVNRDRPQSLPAAYSKFQMAGDFYLISAAVVLHVSASAIVATLYDARYARVSEMIGVLAVGLYGMRFQVLEQIYLAHGRPAYMTAANIARIVGLISFCHIGFMWAGGPGAVIGVAAAQYCGWPFAIWYRWRYGLRSLRAEWGIAPALLAGWVAGWCLVQMLTGVQFYFGRGAG